MSVRLLKEEKGNIHFCTFTCYKWIPLFELTDFYSQFYQWFDFLAKSKIQIIAYSIMPNHFHGMFFLPETAPTINKVIGEGKRFMAYPLVTVLEKRNEVFILNKLKTAVTAKEKLKGIKHKVFEPSFDSKPCFTDLFIQQKLDYIHYNPVKAGLVSCPEDYVHSSGRFYHTGSQGIYAVTDYRDAGIYDGN